MASLIVTWFPLYSPYISMQYITIDLQKKNMRVSPSPVFSCANEATISGWWHFIVTKCLFFSLRCLLLVIVVLSRNAALSNWFIIQIMWCSWFFHFYYHAWYSPSLGKPSLLRKWLSGKNHIRFACISEAGIDFALTWRFSPSTGGSFLLMFFWLPYQGHW